MQPKPRLSEKNACPMAPITTGPVILPKSWVEKEAEPGAGLGQHKRIDAENNNESKQQWHEHIAYTLNAACHAARDD